jgi:hypothetical protein
MGYFAVSQPGLNFSKNRGDLVHRPRLRPRR